MISQEAAKQALLAAIVAMVSPIPVLLDHADASVLEGDHVQVLVTSDTGIGQTQRVTSTTQRQERLMVVQVSGYGEAAIGAGAVSSLLTLASLLRSDDSRALTLHAAGVAVQGVGEVRDLTAYWQSDHEPRAVLTLRVGYTRLLTDSDEGPAATSIQVDILESVPTTAAVLVTL